MFDGDSNNEESERMAEDMVDAVRENPDIKDNEDGLSPREREVEKDKEQERIRKAQELRKQLRKRELGILTYRWPAATLILSGVMAIFTQFQQVMVHPPGIGFDTFLDVLFSGGSLFFAFPLIAGVFLIICGIFAYKDPRWPWVAAIPAMMMAMSGITVYFLITFAVTVDPDAVIYATGTPFVMLIVALLALISITLREKE